MKESILEQFRSINKEINSLENKQRKISDDYNEFYKGKIVLFSGREFKISRASLFPAQIVIMDEIGEDDFRSMSMGLGIFEDLIEKQAIIFKE